MERAILLWQVGDLISQLAWKTLFWAVVHGYEVEKLPWMAENGAMLRGTP